MTKTSIQIKPETPPEKGTLLRVEGGADYDLVVIASSPADSKEGDPFTVTVLHGILKGGSSVTPIAPGTILTGLRPQDVIPFHGKVWLQNE